MSTYRTKVKGRYSPEQRDLDERIKLLNEEAREVLHDPTSQDAEDWRAERAAEMNQIMMEGFDHENLLDLFTEVKTVEEGDQITLSEIKGMRVFWVSQGGTIDQSTLQKETWELVEDRVGFQISEHEDKLRANFWESINDIIAGGIKQLDGAINANVLSLYQEAINPGGFAEASYVATPGITLDVINDAIAEVQDESEDEELPAIIGRATTVRQIFDAIQTSGFFAPETNDTLIRLGVLGVYRGARIIKLRNFKDADGVSRFPRNELYVTGRDATLTGFWGTLRTWEWWEDGEEYWYHKARRKVGVALHHPERVRRIKDTSLPA